MTSPSEKSPATGVENGKERRPIIMPAVTTQSFANDSREQPQLALDTTTPESNDSSLTNNIAAAHNEQGFSADIDDEIKKQDVLVRFPPGYRFCPTDEELIIFYLKKKVLNQPLPFNKIVEVNLYAYNPDFLAEKFKDYQEDQLYIFTPRDRKYRNGSRPNRAAGDGYWKATGADKQIKSNETLVGYRKALVFYIGKAPKGDKTEWIMHEFRVEDSPCSKRGSNGMRLDDWVLCRIYKKPVKSTKNQTEDNVPVMVGSTSMQDNNDGVHGEDDEMNYLNLEGAAIADVRVPIIGASTSTSTFQDGFQQPESIGQCSNAHALDTGAAIADVKVPIIGASTSTSTFQNGFQQPESIAQCSNAYALDTGATFNGNFQVMGGNYSSPLPPEMVAPVGFWPNWVYNSTETILGSNHLNELSEFQENLWMRLPSNLECTNSNFCPQSYDHLPGSFPNIKPDGNDDWTNHL